MPLSKHTVKDFVAEIPYLTEFTWWLDGRKRPPSKKFSLEYVRRKLPEWKHQLARLPAHSARQNAPARRIALFSAYRLWIQHSVLLGMGLAGLGHRPTLVFLPFTTWRKDLSRFNLKRQNLYAKHVLKVAEPYLSSVSLYDWFGQSFAEPLPEELRQEIAKVSLRDVQYSLQIEEFDNSELHSEASKLLALRQQRNLKTAQAAWAWLHKAMPDLVLIPNGSILEMGSFYLVARFLGIPVVTYEFGEQRQRIWLAENDEVMRQNTDVLWETFCNQTFTESQKEKVAALYRSRKQADLWENFSRRWQGISSQGADETRKRLGLTGQKPIVLLAANVIGDSLTLDRQIFTRSMTEWIQRTVNFFLNHPEVDVLVRIHPGEKYTRGPSVAQVIRNTISPLPNHIYLIGADEPLNTYDLIELADVGLVYTTTTGLEMAMGGLPVIVGGQTHYRQRGFTHDPSSWDEYEALLKKAIHRDPSLSLTPYQIERAWHYAYVFFFEYPQPFPWHLHLADDPEQWPLDQVLSPQGLQLFGQSLGVLSGGLEINSLSTEESEIGMQERISS
jgi:hypothetical protein